MINWHRKITRRVVCQNDFCDDDKSAQDSNQPHNIRVKSELVIKVLEESKKMIRI